MSPIALIALAAFFLYYPRLLLPKQPQHELHGRLFLANWLNTGYCFFWHGLDAEPSTVPDIGPVLLIANHTCAIDHTLILATSNRALGFLIAKQYYDHWFFGTLSRILRCIPVKRDGHDLGATRDALRALGAGRAVAIFPEGRIAPYSGRVIQPVKAGAGFIALKSKAPVIPAFIYGSPCSNGFWECIATPSKVRILFGPPIDLSDLIKHDGGRDDVEVAAQRMMDALVALQDRARANDPAWWNAQSQPGSSPEPISTA